MRYRSWMILAHVVFLGACGDASPTAPTMADPPPPPILVTLTAQVVSSAMQGVRTVADQGFVDPRNVRVVGTVDVTGRSATVTATVTLTHAIDGASPPSPVVSRVFDASPLAPNTGGLDFTTDLPFSVPLGSTASGMVTVEVTGVDARGGSVSVRQELSFDQDLSLKPPVTTCAESDTILCAIGQRFAVSAFWRDVDNDTGHAIVTTGQRFPNKAWFSFPGASMTMPDPEDLDLLVELIDACDDTPPSVLGLRGILNRARNHAECDRHSDGTDTRILQSTGHAFRSASRSRRLFHLPLMMRHVGHPRQTPWSLTRWTRVLGPTLVIALTLVPGESLATQFVSAINLPGCAGATETGTVHSTLQAAVDGAIASNDPVIQMCAGVHRGPIVIGDVGDLERLVIRGVGAEGDPQVTIEASPGQPGPIILVLANAGSVDISNLIVDGFSMMEPSTPGGEVIGIQYTQSSGLLENIIVRNVRDTAGSAVGIGLRARGQESSAGEETPEEDLVELNQVTFANMTGVAAMADGVGMSLVVNRTAVFGPVDPVALAPNGIQVSRGATGTIENSLFVDLRSPAPAQGMGSAIVFVCPAVGDDTIALVRHNSVRNADLGVSLIDADGVEVQDNTIVDPEIGVSLQSWRNDPACVEPTTPTQNAQIVDNLVLDATQAGIALTTLDQAGTVPHSNTIERNSIYADVELMMAPFLVAGEDNTFTFNTVFAGETSRIVDSSFGSGTNGTANIYANNRCFGGIETSAFCR